MPEDRFARTLHDWLVATAPAEAPDRILDAVVARVDALDQPSRPRWPALLAAAAASIIIVVGALLAIAGIARIGNAGPTPSAARAPTAIRCETAPCSFSLAEGTSYASSAFELPVTLRAPSDRWLVDHDEPGKLRLVVGRDERRNVTFLLDPRPTDPLGDPAAPVGAGAQAFANWLQDRAALDVSVPVEVTVAGLRGWAVDVRGAAEYPQRSEGCVTEGACAAVFAYSPAVGQESVLGVASVDVIRLYLLDGADHLVVIAVEARHSAPVEFLDGEARDLLDTLELRGQP